ncbi:helix-turn-helix domain-containing protein [Variovorax sp. DAIF25]|uniref:helix-turn-helix domain-containing protein n=1 Tax=Variovorax sp. DAIF25 TaxID=3080983 RepID=UPI003D6A97F0
MSQAEVAAGLGVAQQTIASWEAGRSMPPPEVIIDLCEMYGTMPNFLLLADPAVRVLRFEECPPEGRTRCRALGFGVMQQRATHCLQTHDGMPLSRSS